MRKLNDSMIEIDEPKENQFDVSKVRQDFSILTPKLNKKRLVYLDNAASTQKPNQVVDEISSFYKTGYANIHRGVYELSQKATETFEKIRLKVQQFINAKEAREVIFVKGTTEATNLIASTYARKFLDPGDEILISAMEHHANIVPWQLACKEAGAILRVAPINDKGEILLEDFKKALGPKTRLVAITHVSNVLGTINPIAEVIKIAHNFEVPVLVDGAQAAPHFRVDVQELDCDFYAFSGHKLYGPTGIGVLYGKKCWLEVMPPYQSGGDMISSVSFHNTQFKEIPYKFEAGTPHIAGVVGLGGAINYLEGIGLHNIAAYEKDLLSYATQEISAVPGVQIVGEATNRAGVISFLVDEVHAHDVGTILDQEGIAIRAGHHCAQPLMERLGLTATARASFGLYNTREEVALLVRALYKVREVFG